MGILLKIIFIGMAFYYVFKFVGKLLLGSFFAKVAKQQANHQQNYRGQSQQQYKKAGDMNIKYAPKDSAKHVKGGDYVDYEEI